MIETVRPRKVDLNFSHHLAKGLVFAWLPSEPSARAMDSSGYKNHASLMSMDPATDWVFNRTLGRWCLDFDGSNDYVEVPKNASVEPTELSVAAWIYPTRYRDASGIITKGMTPSTVFGFALSLGADYKIFWGIGTTSISGHWQNHIKSVLNIPLNSWTHVVGTYRNGLATIYLNGRYENSGTQYDPVYNSQGLWIGQWRSSYTFMGLITDAMMWNRALTPKEVWSLSRPWLLIGE